jgi:hypothetical protein
MVRDLKLFTPPQCRTKSYKDSFCPTVLDLWNKLDNDIRNIQSLSSFKIKLRKTFQCYMTRYKEKENLLNHVNLLLPIMKWWTASNISVFSSTVRIGEPFNNISFYSIGSHSLNIWHCQLRNEASSLNHHLFQSHLSDGSQCACGDAIENNFSIYCIRFKHKIIKKR